MRWTGTDPGLGPSRKRAELATALASYPLVLVCAVAPSPSCVLEPGPIIDFVESLAKGEPPIGLTVVVAGTPEALPVIPRIADLLSGSPASMPRRDLLGDRAPAWRAYVHARLAWESAGEPANALEMDRTFNVTNEADDQLEFELNRWAEAKFRQRTAEVPGVEDWCFRKVESKTSRSEDEAAVRSAVAWRPGDGFAVGPVPWLSRALLLDGRFARARELLRSSLVCAPLARLILDVCFDLEAHLRGKVNNGGDVTSFSDEACSMYRRFQDIPERSPARFYPEGCPARPVDRLSFESLGKIASLVSGHGLSMDHIMGLVGLRNAVAHGHYVSWNSVMALRRAYREVL